MKNPNQSTESGVLHGVLTRFDLATLEDFRKKFPKHYANWERQSDIFGRPLVILAMMDRVKDFDTRKLFVGKSPQTLSSGWQTLSPNCWSRRFG